MQLIRFVLPFCVLSLAPLLWLQPAVAAPQAPRMGVFTKPDAVIDLDLVFSDETGTPFTLRDRVVNDKPFILIPIFYGCPRLCSLTFSGAIQLVNDLSLTLGKDYSIISYSFNPNEGPAEAAAKRDSVFKRLTAPTFPPHAWRFLTGSADTIQRIDSQLDFRVRMADKEFEHSSAIFIVDANGRVRKYFTGVEFDAGKVRDALESRTEGIPG